MQLPESWLRTFCNPALDTQGLADALTMGGLEVEDVRPAAPPFEGVVVGAIVGARPHPDAQKLRLCEVDVGSGQPLTIVCGAANARIGLRVPCALPGAVLPAGADGQPVRIGITTLRGVESQGMLCSARELGLSDDHAGLLELDAAALPGTSLRQWLQLDDTVLTLKLTPNLAHALSVYGVARELSALTGAPLRQPEHPPVAAAHADRLPVQILAPDLCGRFSGRIVRGVDPSARTPDWMLRRLERCGQRSVNALVDISNYVMFEFGRPSHIFDLDRIRGGLQVRWARDGETLQLLVIGHCGNRRIAQTLARHGQQQADIAPAQLHHTEQRCQVAAVLDAVLLFTGGAALARRTGADGIGRAFVHAVEQRGKQIQLLGIGVLGLVVLARDRPEIMPGHLLRLLLQAAEFLRGFQIHGCLPARDEGRRPERPRCADRDTSARPDVPE